MWKAFARAAVLGLGVWAAVAQAQTPPAQALPNLPLVVQGTVYATARQADGGLILGGDFAAIGGVARRNLARLLPNGDVDPDWQPAWTSDPVLAVAVDGTTVYAGGKATFLRAFAGTTASTLWTRSTQGGYVHAFAVKDDHALFVGGSFSALDGVAAQGLAKLDAAGAPTEAALAAADELEATTDRLAAEPWEALGPAGVERAAALLTEVARAAAPLLMWPNPVGVPDPREPATA